MTMVPRAPHAFHLKAMSAEPGFIPSLNGLRAISILVVFFSHTISNRIFPGGFGVRVFFLISGFLIARLLFAEWKAKSAVSLSDFYVRRFFRLYPVVIVYCAVVIFLYGLREPDRIVWQEPISAIFYYANYYYSHLSQLGDTSGRMPFVIFWSLSVEEHFYLLFPILFALLRADPRKMMLACIAILIFCLSLRLAMASASPELIPSRVFYFETQYQFDAIAAGVLLASLCEDAKGQRFLKRLLTPTAIVFVVVLLLMSFAIRDAFFRETLRYTMLSAAIFVVIVNVLFSARIPRVQAVLNLAVMDWIGRLSYSIYVWHYAARSMLSVESGIWWQNFLLWLTVTLIAASASYYLIERPILDLRRRLQDGAPKQIVAP